MEKMFDDLIKYVGTIPDPSLIITQDQYAVYVYTLKTDTSFIRVCIWKGQQPSITIQLQGSDSKPSYVTPLYEKAVGLMNNLYARYEQLC